MIDHYCCFVCADQNKTEDRSLGQSCSSCGRKFGFPLKEYPSVINGFEVIKPLSRGYYSVAYKVKHPKFTNRVSVLKVIPKLVYKNHGKNFDIECQQHDKIANNSGHIVKIQGFFDAKILFGDCEIDSHVAELEFVDGFPLEKVLDGEEFLTAPEVTQVALDLFRILFDLQKMEVRHNDLHGGNVIVQRLDESQYRLGAVEPRIRVKAIDINSATGGVEDYMPDRPRDIQRVAGIVRRICQRLLENPDSVRDLHYRALAKLVEISFLLDTNTNDVRSITLEEIIRIIKTEYEESQYAQSAPWNKKFTLTAVNDYYNAQALEPWFASHLFVDPENKWIKEIDSPGPQLITGMRGCGKTILLKSLQFHASANNSNGLDKTQLIGKLKNDGYVGLYVSSSRLIDAREDGDFTPAFSILFIAFMKSALQALKHLADLDTDAIVNTYHENFTKLLAEIFPNHKELLHTTISATLLNFELEKMQFSLDRGEEDFRISIKPAIAFERLAEAIQKSAIIWHNHHIFYLLDDVSTRYVEEQSIRNLISKLLIQNPNFSFKFTSEEHTIRYLLHSPGNIEPARIGRDYELFDFGNAVREKIHGTHSKGRKKFVEEIFKKRFSYLRKYVSEEFLPKKLLGDKTLEDLARAIGDSTKTSKERKKLYSGFSVLIGMCVGDIGDILNLYDRFLHLSPDGKQLSASQQTSAYLDFSSLRLYDLQRRKTDMEKYVMGFAAASHNRLMESVKNLPKSGRIRQYNSIYVRITSTDSAEQERMLKKINKLIDAGIFVSSGIAFRTKTHDHNPLLQFSLVFRKIFGLSHFIGLAQKDRFELSGDDVQKWLDTPEETEQILLACQVSEEPNNEDPIDEADDEIEQHLEVQVVDNPNTQPSLFDSHIANALPPINKSRIGEIPKVSLFSEPSRLLNTTVDNLIIGLGFEERTVESLKRYCQNISPKLIIAYKYSESEYSRKTLELLHNSFPKAEIRFEPYEGYGYVFPQTEGTSLVDVSGLSKALIFNILRRLLINRNTVYIAHTESKTYYPTDDEMNDVLSAYKDNDPTQFLDSLDKILGGEQGPYEAIDLLKSETDKARNRVLIGFAKPKNERLYHVLDNYEFDRIELIKPSKGSSNRSKVASIVADIVGRKYSNTLITEFGANDLNGILNFINDKYHDYYLDLHSNIEVSLTGSKRQTIAVALLSTKLKFSRVWYIKPKAIDESRFSTGVGETNFIQIEMP
jgi:hypothetical protein